MVVKRGPVQSVPRNPRDRKFYLHATRRLARLFKTREPRENRVQTSKVKNFLFERARNEVSVARGV